MIRIFALTTLIPLLLMSCTMNTREILLDGEWLFQVDSGDVGVRERWYADGTERTAWTRHQLPGFWDRYNDLAAYDGAGWYAKKFEFRDTASAYSIVFAGVDDNADVWLNGEPVGTHVGYSDLFTFEVSKFLKPGINELVVRVFDMSGPGGIYKPVTILPTADVEKMLHSPYADKDARTSAEWVHDAVIYEVYLRSFSPEGTFKGLEDRLSELKSLGVTVVWLMPIHPVGELNRKGTLGSPYSISDYYGINPEFGTLDDFRSLVAATHRQGMKIIVDLVANHTSWDSKLLLEHPEFFTKNEEGAIVAPNADWTDVADLNYDSHELRKYMIRMMRYWVEDVGIDGYRCDVAELVPTDFWNTARGELEKIKPVMMLAEGTLPEHHVKAFDLTYAWNTYDVLSHIIDGETHADVFNGLLRSEANQYPRNALRLRFNTNHDKNAWDAPAVEKFTPAGAKATAVLAFTLPGVPLIYNGEEVGNPKRLSLFEKVDIDWSTGEEFRTLYTALTEMRSAHPALRRGSYIPLENSGGPKILTFARQSGNDAVLIAVNFSREQRPASVELTSELGNAWRQVNGAVGFRQEGKTLSFDLPAFGHLILARKN